MIYLDHNATTAIDPEVLEAMNSCLRHGPANPGSLHGLGRRARKLVWAARRQVAGLIGATPEEIIFTGSGTQADNLALFGALVGARAGRTALVTTAVEHRAVLEPARALGARGHAVRLLDVDGAGRVAAADVAAAVTPETALVSLMLANNETGVLEPVAETARALAGTGVALHTDAVQAAGRIPVNVAELGVDLLSLSSHKLYGPGGVGALYVRAGTRLAPVLHGGGQENGLWPGTLNVAGIVGFGRACALAAARLAAETVRLAALRDAFEAAVAARLPEAVINAGTAPRLPNTSSITLPGLNAEALAVALDQRGVAVGTGSACGSADHGPSHVLAAMGRTDTDGALRFSFGRANTDADLDPAVAALVDAVRQHRQPATGISS